LEYIFIFRSDPKLLLRALAVSSGWAASPLGGWKSFFLSWWEYLFLHSCQEKRLVKNAANLGAFDALVMANLLQKEIWVLSDSFTQSNLFKFFY
jgi:hypothetical protein